MTKILLELIGAINGVGDEFQLLAFGLVVLIIFVAIVLVWGRKLNAAALFVVRLAGVFLVVFLMMIGAAVAFSIVGRNRLAELERGVPSALKDPLEIRAGGAASDSAHPPVEISPAEEQHIRDAVSDLQTFRTAGVSGFDQAAVYAGRLAFYRNETDKARQMLQEAADQDPSAEKLNELGVVEYKARNLAKAEALFRQAVELEPGYPNAVNNLGIIAYSKGDLTEAVNYYDRALQNKPDYYVALNNRGLAYRDLARRGATPTQSKREYLEKASKDLLAARKIRSGDGTVNLNLALLSQELGKTDEAIRFYERAIEANPMDPQAYNNLAMIRAEDKDRLDADRAVALARKAVGLAPDNYAYRDTLARAYFAAGNLEEALAAVKTAREGAQRTGAPYLKDTAELQKRIEAQSRSEMLAQRQ